MACNECGKPLTDDEKEFLEGRCEICERSWHEALKDWRNGGDNPDFDKAFSSPKPTIQ